MMDQSEALNHSQTIFISLCHRNLCNYTELSQDQFHEPNWHIFTIFRTVLDHILSTAGESHLMYSSHIPCIGYFTASLGVCAVTTS